jgi:hypothetical protein
VRENLVGSKLVEGIERVTPSFWTDHEYFTVVAFDAQDDRVAADRMVRSEVATIV